MVYERHFACVFEVIDGSQGKLPYVQIENFPWFSHSVFFPYFALKYDGMTSRKSLRGLAMTPANIQDGEICNNR